MNKEKGQENGIRPIKIRIVNPTPKSEKNNKNGETDKKPRTISFLFFVMLGCLSFFLIYGIYTYFRETSVTTWKLIVLINLFFLFFSYGLPILFYSAYRSESINDINWKTKPILFILILLLGFVTANLLNIFNSLISLLLQKLNFIHSTWTEAPYIDYFIGNSFSHILIYLLVLCFIPAFLQEFGLRQILIKRNFGSKVEFKLLLTQGLITALLSFNPQLFIPTFGLGILSSYIFISFGHYSLNVVFHFCFCFSYHYLLSKIELFNFTFSRASSLSDYFPLILNVLLSLCIFLPVLIIIEQMTTVNPIWKSDNKISLLKKMRSERFFSPSLLLIGIFYIASLLLF
ncbi:MAG: hypothetical protein GX326_03845 [Clostridiaceae bacterium]|nr:hypothetical protein [Clostridiaceae bacterium]